MQFIASSYQLADPPLYIITDAVFKGQKFSFPDYNTDRKCVPADPTPSPISAGSKHLSSVRYVAGGSCESRAPYLKNWSVVDLVMAGAVTVVTVEVFLSYVGKIP